jgi:hypothetical protein
VADFSANILLRVKSASKWFWILFVNEGFLVVTSLYIKEICGLSKIFRILHCFDFDTCNG